MTDQSGAARRGRTAKKSSFLRDFLVSIAVALVLSLILKTFLVQAFFIPSASMEDTLQEGDRILVNKLVPGNFDVSRGDIVVFVDPGGWLPPMIEQPSNPVSRVVSGALSFVGLGAQNSGEHLVKRTIGLPGDTVECCDVDGRLIVNGQSINETYIAQGDDPSNVEFKVTVPEDKLWLMGDHRSDSKDSRFNPQTDSGFVPLENVVGVAFVIIWPFSSMTILNNPDETFEKVPNPRGQ